MVLEKIIDTEIIISISELLSTAPRIRVGIGKEISIESINKRLYKVFVQVPANSVSTSNSTLPPTITNCIKKLKDSIRSYHSNTARSFKIDSGTRFTGIYFEDNKLFSQPPKEYRRDLLYIPVIVDGQRVKAYIDLGSYINVINRSIVRKISSPQLRLNPKLTLTPVDRGSLGVYTIIEGLPFNIGDIVTESHTVVVEESSN